MTKLEKAKQYEKEHQLSEDQLPAFHYAAPIGWINDPNGFSFFDGKVHLFAQYHPYNNQWGPMHWLHQTTENFIDWTLEGCALAPDQDYDHAGVFSGSAIEKDGKHFLMYTGVRKDENGEFQQQCLAIGDGKNYEKLKNNPVIPTSLIPQGFSEIHFRDPKVWKEGDRYFVVCGSLDEKGQGQAILFSSDDLMNWKFENVMAHSKGTFGSMWECPDFFELDGTPILMFSPQDMRAKGLEFHNGHNSVWLTGPFENHQFKDFTAHSLDYGLDFYAPQSVLLPDGRRVMIAWMASWDNPIFKKDFDFAGQMTFPREMWMQEGKLMQKPVRELEVNRINPVHLSDIKIDGTFKNEKIAGRCSELIIRFKETQNLSALILGLAKSEKEEFESTLTWYTHQNLLEFDRTWSGMTSDSNAIRRAKAPEGGIQEIRVLIDRFSIEIFINDGEMVMSNAITTPIFADEIEIETIGSCKADIDFYTIQTK